MAVKIRLRRIGAKKKPFYRIVVADSRFPRDGRNLEEIGYYNPLTEPKEIKIDVERVNYWMSVGARPSETVKALIAKAGETGYVAPGKKAAKVDNTKSKPAKAKKIEEVVAEEAAPAEAKPVEKPAPAEVKAVQEAPAEAEPAAEEAK